jgi:RecB family endonuclease NucS
MKKDHLDVLFQCGIVYKMFYQCDVTYVGQTKRHLNTRIKEREINFNKRNGFFSVISHHRLEFSHDFDWNSIQILDKESSYNKRLVLEYLLNEKILIYITRVT